MNFDSALGRLNKLDDFEVVSRGTQVTISNTNFEELSVSVEKLQDPARFPLSSIFPSDGYHHRFIEFWEEGTEIKISDQTFLIIGENIDGIFLRALNKNIIYIFYDAGSNLEEVAYFCGHNISEFSAIFCMLQSLVQNFLCEQSISKIDGYSDLELSVRKNEILDTFEEKVCKHFGGILEDTRYGKISYWKNVIELIDEGEYPIRKDFLYYKKRSDEISEFS